MTVLNYEKLYNSYYMQVYSYVVTIVKDQSLAEEITQNTFFKAMTAKRTYEGKASELTWLCSIAKNLAMDECRKNSKYAELDEEMLEQPDNMTKAVEDKDTALRIHLVLHELEEPYKEVFQLRVFGELPFAQIGMIFGKTENWARVTYHRARLKIKERMDKNE
uniref:RNA polymerase sigma factor n=1 Tax=Agathobacter sp. TaxID=2021311 RepID=UPI004025C4CB